MAVTQLGYAAASHGCMAKLDLEDAYRKWSGDLGRYATVLVGPADAPDVVADAVVSLLRSDGWDEVLNQRAYLYKAVLNSARMSQRTWGRRRAREDRATHEVAGYELETDVEAREWLGSLSVQQRAAIHLAYWEDLPAAKIAEILGVGEGTVRRHLARGRAKLRRVISHD